MAIEGMVTAASITRLLIDTEQVSHEDKLSLGMKFALCGCPILWGTDETKTIQSWH